MAVAVARAIGSRFRDGALRNPDHLAEHFLPLPYRPMVRYRLGQAILTAIFERQARGQFFYVQARTRHIDGLLLDELKAGVEQVVILGAGFDSRAHRLAAPLAGRPVFEVDHPATQYAKRERLRRLPQATVAAVHYVALDFTRGRLDEALAAGGHDRSKKTFFLMEGVTMYLTGDAVESTLAYLAGAAAGSPLVFDYIYRDILDGTADYYGARQVLRTVAKSGEPFQWGLPPGGAAAFLRARGFDLVSDLGPDELTRRYLLSSSGEAIGRLTGYLGLVHAHVKG
jgi:methyltransferase (TIGR00027 family)